MREIDQSRVEKRRVLRR